MAQKRKAQEAFGQANGRLSAFAAARLAKQPKPANADVRGSEETTLGAVVAEAPYDGHHAAFDISSEDGIEDDVQITTSGGPSPRTPLSTIKPKSVRELEDGSLEINLRSEETAVCVGIYDVEVIKGIIIVYGATLTPNSGRRRIYAPSTAALPPLVARRGGTVIRLHHVKCGLSKLGKLSPLFKKVWTKGKGSKGSFSLLYSTDDDELQRSLSPLEVDRTTEKLLARLSIESNVKTPRVMAIGAKSSGKSTLNRLICNTLHGKPTVQKLQYLDLDPGQPEFGVPGQISLVEVDAPLLGPSFTHLASVASEQYRLVRCHSIAATSFKDDPDHYLACAKNLVQHVNPRMPLVINSCGWVSGLGATIAADLVKITGVTDLIVLDPVDETLIELLQQKATAITVHRTPRQPPRPSARTPAELRNMQTMAYFHQRASSVDTTWSSQPISTARPWLVKYTEPNAGIRAIVSYAQLPHPDLLAEVLNGSLVALITIENPHLPTALGRPDGHDHDNNDDDPTTWLSSTPEGLPYPLPHDHEIPRPLDPKHSHCVGLALVRAIDVEQRELQLVTPIPAHQIAALVQKAVVLVSGSFDAPEWAYLEDLYGAGGGEATGRPWVSRRAPVGVEGAVWRLRHTPMSRPV
ncbi:mRNA cleavage and polyadenylation factor CLP1 P-loop [Teratosphaeria destructans]|uniref:Polynucleotide 5'-hydroxyl-kinase GRC3 n=1 Tax=Teratosphaeria destructans TaxID=418781 RepID=A0A9W7SQC4_9PEZI|nr:mRNA cleavage and polyadenylation factor CLP1 P-loop [Teratosphaeria destructans]